MLLTVPLLCSLRWRGFECKRAHEVQRCLTQILVMQRGPQIDHVSLLLTAGAEALKGVVIEVHAEGAATTVRAMDWAGAAHLRACAVQLPRQVEVFQHAHDLQLRLDVIEIDEGVLAGLGVVW